MTIDPDKLRRFVDMTFLIGDEECTRILRELLWLAYCRLCYTQSDRTTEMKAIRHEWAVLEAKLGVD